MINENDTIPSIQEAIKKEVEQLPETEGESIPKSPVLPAGKSKKRVVAKVKALKRSEIIEPIVVPVNLVEGIDWELVEDLLGKGYSKADAMKLAGSKSKHPTSALTKKLMTDREFGSRLVLKIREKVQMGIDAIKKQKMNKESAKDNALTIKNLVETMRLIEGKSTSNIAIEGHINISSMTKEEQVRAYKRFVHG